MDSVMADDARLPTDIDAQPVVQAAAALQPMLRECREQIEAEQRFPKPLVERLRSAHPGVAIGLHAAIGEHAAVIEAMAAAAVAAAGFGE